MKCTDCKKYDAGLCTLTNDPTDPDINLECDYSRGLTMKTVNRNLRLFLFQKRATKIKKLEKPMNAIRTTPNHSQSTQLQIPIIPRLLRRRSTPVLEWFKWNTKSSQVIITTMVPYPSIPETKIKIVWITITDFKPYFYVPSTPK